LWCQIPENEHAIQYGTIHPLSFPTLAAAAAAAAAAATATKTAAEMMATGTMMQ